MVYVAAYTAYHFRLRILLLFGIKFLRSETVKLIMLGLFLIDSNKTNYKSFKTVQKYWRKLIAITGSGTRYMHDKYFVIYSWYSNVL